MSDAYRVSTRRQVRWLVIPSMMEYIAAGFRSAVLAAGRGASHRMVRQRQGVGFRAHFWYDARSFEGMMAWGVVMMVIILAFDRLVMDRVGIGTSLEGGRTRVVGMTGGGAGPADRP